MSQIHHYDLNGFYITSEEARLDPIDRLSLVPLNATQIAPPSVVAGEIAKFSDGTWLVVEHPNLAAIREEEARLEAEAVAEAELIKTNKLSETNSYGVLLFELSGNSVVSRDPSAIEGETNSAAFSRIRELRNSLLSATDYTQLSDSPLSAPKKTEFATYRQALRDLPDSISDPTAEVSWPAVPAKE